MVNVCSCIAQYPVRRTPQGALHVNPWPTCSFRYQLGFSGKHSVTLPVLRKDYSVTYFHHCLFLSANLNRWVNCQGVVENEIAQAVFYISIDGSSPTVRQFPVTSCKVRLHCFTFVTSMTTRNAVLLLFCSSRLPLLDIHTFLINNYNLKTRIWTQYIEPGLLTNLFERFHMIMCQRRVGRWCWTYKQTS